MNWEVLIVPIIGVALWIISTLIRGAEEAKGQGKASQRKSEKTTDLDRFLREIQRRKQQAGQGEPERPARAPAAEESPRADRRREAPTRARRRAPEPEAIPVALPVEEVPAARPVPLVPVMVVLEAAPLPEVPPDRSARSLPPRPVSTALAGLNELLRTRDGLRKSMILQEVLGPPVSRRRR